MSSVPPPVAARIESEKGLIALAEASSMDMEANRAAIERGRYSTSQPETVTWFVPQFDHVLKGGLRTIFSVAEQMSRSWGTRHHFVVYSFTGRDFDDTVIRTGFDRHFPDLVHEVHKFRRGIHSVDDLPRAQVGVCTLWTTAYLLLKYNCASRKYYFLQDFEPVFYPGGSVSAVIEATYRFGFTCIANSLGVAQSYRRYSDDVYAFTPGLDHEIFHPREGDAAGEPRRIVFYGRPNNDRNAFALGLDVLRRVKEVMGAGVRIQSVGAAWDEAEFGVRGMVENLGLLTSMEAVADLYRAADAGLVFMFSAHPSYQPIEYMGCGSVVVTNANENNAWLLEHDRNCLAVNPVPGHAADEIVALLGDAERMRRLRAGGLRTVATMRWDAAYETIMDALCGSTTPMSDS